MQPTQQFRNVNSATLAAMQSTEQDPDRDRSDIATALAAQVESYSGPGQEIAWSEYAEEQQRLTEEANLRAAELVREEQQTRRELEAATMRKLAAGQKIPPVRIARMPAENDLTIPQDIAGRNFTPPGERIGWFAMFGPNGKPSTTRTAEMTRAGFKFVKDEDGRVITRLDQVAMSAPPEQWARYKAGKALQVTQSVESRTEQFQTQVDQQRLRSGRRVGASWVPNEQEFEDLNRAVTPK